MYITMTTNAKCALDDCILSIEIIFDLLREYFISISFSYSYEGKITSSNKEKKNDIFHRKKY